MDKKSKTNTTKNSTNTQSVKRQKTISSFSKEEIKKLEKKEESFGKNIALFLFYTGLRVSEALSLNVSDVSSEYVTVKGKGSKVRTVHLNKKAIAIVQKLISRVEKYREIESDTPLFISQKAKRLDRSQAYRLVREVTSDITKKPIRTSPHTLRHTHATLSLKNGIDIKHVSTQLGHSSVSTTQDIYQHSDLEDLKYNELL